jgi:hypothetical protein
MNHLIQAGVEAVVLEFSDGLYQDEIADMFCTSAFRHEVCPRSRIGNKGDEIRMARQERY